MDLELRKVWGDDVVDNLKDAIGDILKVEFYAPGIYYVAAKNSDYSFVCTEYYVIEKTTSIISYQVKTYGDPVKSCPNLLLFQAEKEQGGYELIEFEVAKYRIQQNIPLGDLDSPRLIAMYYTEDYPEYFGPYPAPTSTPFGYMLRYKTLQNGIFWIETDQGQYTLALCQPIHEFDLSDIARKLGKLTECDKMKDIKNVQSYLFFSEQDSCIPLFEISRVSSRLAKLDDLDFPALMNAIWANHVEYAILQNSLVQQGNSLSIIFPPSFPFKDIFDFSAFHKDMVLYTPNRGTNFIHF